MKTILYFVRGVPSEAELKEAEDNRALIRDCTAWHERDCLEECDIVMGKPENVPLPYRHLMQGANVESSQSDSLSEDTQPVSKCRKSNKADNVNPPV